MSLRLIAGQALGMVLGVVLAPIIALFSWVRGTRVLHAEGVVVSAKVTEAAGAPGGELGKFARTLVGPATVRFSLGMTPGRDAEAVAARNILGLGLVLGARETQRHLALATFESFSKFGRDRIVTVTGDYLANVYQSVAAFALDGFGLARFRVSPFELPAAPAGDRERRLSADIGSGNARLVLEVGGQDGQWLPVAVILLMGIVEGPAFRLSIHRTGPGLRAVGVLAGVRRVVYPVAQWARARRRP
jgi:hypothetical protein